ncbi:uncharacterized protein FIBRA_09419 [Fibroporia radiculosa]|uniref:Uncharacterized protein n=1 Tax=Fibroporia radiculosa TaxID=599839 RepID=J7RHL7_9APHY|nr:uncharacterized protein FIBRA_09419 [Fibroporia radiculosa]CCM07092.1 predicted protein [Fibroporia radiculosa]
MCSERQKRISETRNIERTRPTPEQNGGQPPAGQKTCECNGAAPPGAHNVRGRQLFAEKAHERVSDDLWVAHDDVVPAALNRDQLCAWHERLHTRRVAIRHHRILRTL